VKLAVVLLAFTLYGQEQPPPKVSPAPKLVKAQYVPEPMIVLKSLHIKDFGVWTCRICSDLDSVITIPKEKVFMAAGTKIRPIDELRATSMLMQGQSKHWTLRTLRILGIAGAATLLAMRTSTDPSVLKWLGVGSSSIPILSEFLSKDVPDLSPYLSNMLKADVVLSAGHCATYSIFAAKMKRVETFEVTIDVGIKIL
jgi:hypothetical protein